MRVLVSATSLALLSAPIAASQAQSPASPAALPDYHGVRRDLPANTSKPPEGPSIGSKTPFTALYEVAMYPVLYCGNAGGGQDEYSVPSAAGIAVWRLEVPSPPADARMYDVRYEPYENIAAIGSFALLMVAKADDRHIDVTVRAYPNCGEARIRIRITASYAK